MKKFYLLIIPFLLLSSCGGSSNNTSTIEVKEGYELFFQDEFDSDYLDENNWNYMYGDGSMYGNPGWGNQEIQYYQEENVSVRDGNLIITAKRENAGGKPFTSARINSKGKVAVKYGRIEARISLPEVEGLWPAFWMLPEASSPYGGWPASGEIDIMEARGRVNDMTSAALHYGPITGSSVYQSKGYIFRDSTISEYHVYAVEWSTYKMSWYVDDDKFFEIDNSPEAKGQKWYSMADPDSLTAPFDQDFHILLNCAIGGHFDGFIEPPADFESAEMKVDYVRIFKEVA